MKGEVTDPALGESRCFFAGGKRFASRVTFCCHGDCGRFSWLSIVAVEKDGEREAPRAAKPWLALCSVVWMPGVLNVA